MDNYKFILEKYRSKNDRYLCPSCNVTPNSFTRYINITIRQHLGDHVGRCNREVNCGYHYTPKQYFLDQGSIFSTNRAMNYKVAIPTSVSTPSTYIDSELLRTSLKGYTNNHFVTFLKSLFGTEKSLEAISKYKIGSSKYWPGSVVFWQIDRSGQIRTGKIMLYDPVTGKRRKDMLPPIQWAHKAAKLRDFKLEQCLFGEDLLNDEVKVVALVESEKSAVIASIVFPEYIWLATGGLDQLNKKCFVLKGRTVIMFPDAGGHKKWSQKAKELSQIGNFKVSNLIERKATPNQLKEGADIADFLIEEFKSPKIQVAKKSLHVSKPSKFSDPGWDLVYNPVDIDIYDSTRNQLHPNFVPGAWTYKIKEIDSFFMTLTSLDEPFNFHPWVSGPTIRHFLEANLEVARAQNGNPTYRPYLNRVIELMNYLRSIP